MNDDVTYLKESVNLEGYALSRGWFGFFELAGKREDGLADLAMEYFCNYFQDQLLDCSIVFSFSIYESIKKARKDYELDNNEIKILKYLLKKNWLKIVSDEPNDEYLAVNTSELSIKDTTTLISAILKLGDFIGHCFILFKESGLIVYPHEDIGFGIIRTAPKGEKVADSFLKEIAKKTKFSAYKGRRREENKYE